MRISIAAALGVGLLTLGHSGGPGDGGRAAGANRLTTLAIAPLPVPGTLTSAELTAVVERYCSVCHNDRLLTGNMSLEDFDVANPAARAEAAERMIEKLRAGMMPPPGVARPGPDTLLALAEALEEGLDRADANAPSVGSRSFQRLNRAEYEASVRELLDLEVGAGDYLPLDTRAAGFDNVVDAQLLSPTLLDAYLRAASEISRLAVGNQDAPSGETQYRVVRWSSQVDRADGAPMGTRGGTSVVHNFPADGEYSFRISLEHETTGEMFGNGRSALHTIDGPEQLEVSIDGEGVALLEIDRWARVADPGGLDLTTEPVFVRAGPHRVAAAFVRRYEGPVQDLVSPHDWSIASTAIAGVYGIQAVPHLKDMVIVGPHRATGVADTPSRRRIFSCRPATPGDEACAEQIVARLAAEAFRRNVGADEVRDLMAFYEEGAAAGGFEEGVRTALEAILASPRFVFRFEPPPRDVRPGERYAVGDEQLASRLSYFLWSGPPDERLLELTEQATLTDPDVLDAEIDRMLADARAEALATRFAAQWLRLQDLERINPDVRSYPDFHQQLKDAMLRETELFFHGLVREDRSVLELFTADYTFVNERLARHYGIAGVTGEEFVRVTYPDGRRRGLLGHGSVLTATSLAGRTSPVLRGKWVMEVILGTPPPPPPPGIPDLDQTDATREGRTLSTRERMEVHRASPVCGSCHSVIDPIGLALDNFDVTGRWRTRENGAALDTRGVLFDGTPVESPADLRRALLDRPISIVRNFTENLLTYALGRRIEYFDMPEVRRIARRAEAEQFRISAFVKGIVESDVFRMQRADPATASTGSTGLP